MTLCTVENIGNWERAEDSSAMNCQDRFVANEMQNFPPCGMNVARRHFAFCLCKKHSQRLRSCQRQRTSGKRTFEQLLVNDGKPERLLVPDLATDWFRKQKVFLDKVTSKEQLQMHLTKQLEEIPNQVYSVCDCNRCSCNEPNLQQTIHYLDYCQELRRRRQLLLRQRHHKRQGELMCDCHSPPKWPYAKSRSGKKKDKPSSNEQAKLKEPEESSKAHKITVCPSSVAGCMPDTSAERTRFTGGLSVRSKGKVCHMYPQRTCCCLRARRRKSCACIYQADGQPMGDECVAACRRFESPMPRLRKKYSLREVSQRRLNPACYRRISPEFYGLLKSYEDGMSKRYPLYGVPLRTWCKTMPCCTCEQPVTDDCEQACLGDNGLEACVGYPSKKEQTHVDEKDTESSEPIEELPQPSYMKMTVCVDNICKVYDCPDLVCNSAKCQQNACDENCESKEQQLNSNQTDQLTCCTRNTCAKRSQVLNADQTQDDLQTGNPQNAPNESSVPTTEFMPGARSLVPKQSASLATTKAPLTGLQRCCYPKQWFFKNKLVEETSACMGDPEAKTKRKGILGSVAGLCKRAIMPGRYLLYSLSTINRQPVPYDSLTKKNQKLPKDPSKEREKNTSFFSCKSKPSAWPQNHRQHTDIASISQGTLWHSSTSCSVLQNKCFYLKRKPVAGQFGKIGPKWISANKINPMPSLLPHRQKFLMVQTKWAELATHPTTEVDKAAQVDPPQGQQKSIQLEEASNEQQTVQQEADNKNVLAPRTDEKPSTSQAARAHAVPKTDYSQLMRLVARKRPKIAHHQRCTVTFAEKQRFNAKQPINLMKTQQPHNSKGQCLSSPDRSRSASPVPKKKQRAITRADMPLQPAQPAYSKEFPSEKQEENLQMPSSVFLSHFSDNSVSLKDQFVSCESQLSKNKARALRLSKDTAIKNSQTADANDYQTLERTAPGNSEKGYGAHGRYPSYTAHMTRLYNVNGLGMQVTDMGDRYSHKVFNYQKTSSEQNYVPDDGLSVNSIARRAQIKMDLKQDISNETSMDTVDHNAERLANITRYIKEPSQRDLKTNSIIKPQNKQTHGLSNLIFSKKPPINNKLINLNNTALRVPKLKVKYPHCRAHSLLRTRRPPPPPPHRQHVRVNQVKMANEDQWRQLFQRANRNYNQSVQFSTRMGQRYNSGRDYNNDNYIDIDNNYGNVNNNRRHINNCRSRSGCDVQFQDNNNPQSNPSKRTSKTFFNSPKTLGDIGHQAPLPGLRTYSTSYVLTRNNSFKGYAAPCSSRSFVATDSRNDSNLQEIEQFSSADRVKRLKPQPVERIETESTVMRKPRVSTSDFLGHRRNDIVNPEYGNRAMVRTSANNNIDSRDVEYVHTPGRRHSGMLPAFSESFGYPEPSRRNSQSSIDYAMPSIKEASHKSYPALPNSILKSASRPLNSILKQANDVRHVNFVPNKMSNSSIPMRDSQPAAVYYDTSNTLSMHSGKNRPSIVRAHSVYQSMPHHFSFVHQDGSQRISLPTAREKIPSIFAVPTTESSQHPPITGNTSAYSQADSGHQRLSTRVKGPEELELEESRLPMNSRLLSKRNDIPKTKRIANDRPMPPAVSLVSDLDFKTHYSPLRHITPTPMEERERGGNTTTDVPLVLTTVLDQLRHKCRGCSTNQCPPTADCRLPLPEPTVDYQYSEPTYDRLQHPCFPHKLLGNTQEFGENYYPRRRCCLRRLPEEPIVIEPTSGGLRQQQMRQNCLPTLFYGRKC